ncbi:amidohydrolase family protein [soil metagenome]
MLLATELFGLALAAAAQPATSAALPLEPARQLETEVTEGTWMSVDVSPDGRKILFDLLGDIYLLDTSGGNAEPLLLGMAFESQPVWSPDAERIAFVSDRGGNENVWVAQSDGTRAEAISDLDDNTEFASPSWSADGRFVYASRIRPDIGAYELWMYDAKGGSGVKITEAGAGKPKDRRYNALGAAASKDGRFLYYAARAGEFEDHLSLPAWHIARRDLRTGREDVVVTAQGSAMRPVLSPDDTQLVYATRFDGETGLRIRDLVNGDDRWLVWPVQHDQQEAWPSMDLMPRYDFTPDGEAVIFTRDNRLASVTVADSRTSALPFRAELSMPIGPSLRVEIEPETGPVRARLIQAPTQSPHGRQVAFSALAHVYVMDLAGGAPERLTDADMPEFQPAWSPDGRSIAYASWIPAGGHLWRAPVGRRGRPERVTRAPAYWSDPVYTPDGDHLLALRSSQHARLHVALEFGQFRQVDVVRLPAGGGEAELITSGVYAGPPQFGPEPDRVYLYGPQGLVSFRLDGSDRREHLRVTGPGFYFQDERVPVDDLRISPDGQWALAQIVSQLHLIAVPPPDGDMFAVDLGSPTLAHRTLTGVGADFIGWTDDGRSITWSTGSTFYRRALETIDFDGKDRASTAPVDSFPAHIEVPRDVPQGRIVLRGATVLTMRGDEIIEDADVLVRNNRIAAVGKRGSLDLPESTEVRKLDGRFLMPGFIDTHAHWADIRRGILDLESYGFLANLAFGVTAGLDVSPLSIDMLAYQDLIDAGLMLGPRAWSTGPAVFSYNEFETKDDVVDVLTRYRDHYRTRNLKAYRTGNRRQRQWVAQAARELGVMPTTEGALNLKLDLTQAIDGFAGNEHALPTVPLGEDVIALFVHTRMSYTPTLVIGQGGPPAMSFFITRSELHDESKIARFLPHFVIDAKARRTHWYADEEYLYPQVATGAAEIRRAGGLLGVGSHGELQGITYHWEMQALAAGGLEPREVLQAATIGSAEVIGRSSDLGSIEAGKLADLIVLEQNPLEDITNTLSLELVMKNGRLYDADTLDEVWPRQRPLPPLWFWNEHPAAE